MHIVCPQCATINRVPAARSLLAAKCGSCHRPLFTGQPVELDETGLTRHLQHSDIPLLVDFWAAWCGPCKVMAPIFQQAAAEMEPQLRFAKVDTERHPQLAGQFGIRSIPTLILYKQGHETARIAGALDLQRLLDWIRQHL